MWLRPIMLAALLLLSGCGRESLQSQESYVFGTRVEVLVWGAPADKGREATAAVLREFDRLHRAYHAWQPSELTALNDAIAAGRPHEVSAELAALIVEARALAAQGDYLFDPGIGALVKLWGFHDETFKPQLPDAEKLAALRQAKPSIAALKVDGRTVTSTSRSVALDFGGYLKGVALDRAAAIMKAHGITNALINIGGNVLALGAKGGTPWRVGIQHPRKSEPLATLELRDGEAIGTSGDYQRYFEMDGRRYSHLIDPRTAEPATGTRALTVLISPGDKAGLWSDVASKPLFVAGDGWKPLAAKLGIAQVLRVDAAGRVEVTEPLRVRLQFVAEEEKK
ncbi:thiamine biosynthesis lipoprotein [Sulfurisoma sediminicola]|uniref:FAD:protein FMN transferase n=3 Tax=Sulfurisoma sediminicola TaxID=1381557 RepID=A0A497XLD8_9PROT|nr:thiamine biosynthesis lipoprotein [Sulfurisoma sediminicola]